MLTCVSAGAVAMLSSIKALQAPRAASNMPAPGNNALPATCFACVPHHGLGVQQAEKVIKATKHAPVIKHRKDCVCTYLVIPEVRKYWMIQCSLQ